MTLTKLSIENSQAEKLVCIEALPEVFNGKKFPVVILCHGFGYFKEEDGVFTEIAKKLSNIGYAVYYFDFSGCGESEGNYEVTTLTKLVGDLKSIYDAVTKYEYIDSTNVSLISHSYGSNVVIAAQIKNLKRIALSGSFTNSHKIISSIFDNFDEHGISNRRATSDRTRTMGPQFWQDIKRYDMETLIKNFDCPILFIHGKLDTLVPIENMEPLFKSAKYPVGPVVLEESNHDLKPERETAFRAIVEFFSPSTLEL